MRILFACTLFFVIACNNAGKNDQKDDVKVAGAWTMLSQRMTSDKTDTTYTDVQQLKIYTDHDMMYANVTSPDSVGSFGVGSYTVKGDTVSEHVVYDASGSSKDDSSRTFQLGITKTDKGYKQVINNIVNMTTGQHFVLTEDYTSSTTEKKSPLDGVWKLTRAMTVNGKDTMVAKVVQYKAFYGGHVIWGNTTADSTNKTHTGMGFGTFEMSGNNKAKENMIASTTSVVKGHSFDLDIAMNGENEFTQTFSLANGSRRIETYQRLK